MVFSSIYWINLLNHIICYCGHVFFLRTVITSSPTSRNMENNWKSRKTKCKKPEVGGGWRGVTVEKLNLRIGEVEKKMNENFEESFKSKAQICTYTKSQTQVPGFSALILNTELLTTRHINEAVRMKERENKREAHLSNWTILISGIAKFSWMNHITQAEFVLINQATRNRDNPSQWRAAQLPIRWDHPKSQETRHHSQAAGPVTDLHF